MERVFTEDHGRYRAGEAKNWPITTWVDFFPGYETFTRPVNEVIAAAMTPQKPARTRAKRHDRTDS